jgi:ABC-type Na+ efflux pump permease subunit
MPATDETPAVPPPTAARPAQVRHQVFSPSRVWALAANTLTELVRLKIFYFLLIFAALLISLPAFLLEFSFQDQFQMLKDVSLGAMSIFTSLLAILATAGLLPKDMEDRTLYTILAKPVSRFEYLLGKICGVLLLLLIATLAMGALFAVVLNWRVHVVTRELIAAGATGEIFQQQVRDLHATAFNSNLWAGGLVIYAKACLLASLTLFISTFASSSIFTIIVSVVVYFIGHVQSTARDYWQATNAMHGTSLLGKVILLPVTVFFPDLQLFNLVDEIVVGTPIATLLLLKTLGVAAMYFSIYLLIAHFLFSTKEL